MFHHRAAYICCSLLIVGTLGCSESISRESTVNLVLRPR